jgi:uncharacterized protein (DUF1697 family)
VTARTNKRAPATRARSGPAGSATSGRQVALLRGINVGRAKRVAMADLRALVEGLGYGDVRTLLNSGNVVYTAPGIEPSEAAARIGEALPARTGVSAKVVALGADEVVEIVEGNPLLEPATGLATDPSRMLVAVLVDPRDRQRLEPLLAKSWGAEALALGERVAYMWCPDGVLASQLPEAVGRALGAAVTTRNWATMTKLHGLLVAE